MKIVTYMSLHLNNYFICVKSVGHHIAPCWSLKNASWVPRRAWQMLSYTEPSLHPYDILPHPVSGWFLNLSVICKSLTHINSKVMKEIISFTKMFAIRKIMLQYIGHCSDFQPVCVPEVPDNAITLIMAFILKC